MSLQELEEQREKDREIELQAISSITDMIVRGLDDEFKEVHQRRGKSYDEIREMIDWIVERNDEFNKKFQTNYSFALSAE